MIILSLSFCQDGKGYRFITGTNDYYMDIENIVESHFGPWDVLTNFSARTNHNFVDVNEKTGQITDMQSWNNVIATTRVDDKVTPNYMTQKMNGASFAVVINEDGTIASITPQDEKSQEMLDMQENDEIGSLMGGLESNFLYPFGSDSIRHIGDSWSIETVGEIDAFAAFDFFEGEKKQAVTYTLKKVKEKRGDEIAYIQSETDILLRGIGGSWEKTVEFTQSFAGTANIQYNVDKGILKSCKMSFAAIGKARDLEDDSVRNFSVNMDIRIKCKLK